MATKWVDESILSGTWALKSAVAMVCGGVLLHYWPEHKAAAFGLGACLGILCAELVPPRQALRSVLLRMAIFGGLGAVLVALKWL